MTESVTRDYSFTVRLSPEEKAALEALASSWTNPGLCAMPCQ